ncbi:MAG: hypothetical protein QXP97_01700 [Desulfurococcus sp.]
MANYKICGRNILVAEAMGYCRDCPSKTLGYRRRCSDEDSYRDT